MSQLERFSEDIQDFFLAHEHAHRYWWASQFACGKRVVDVACGAGYGSAILGKYASHVIGIDIDPDAVSHARATYARDNVEFRTGDCASFSVEEPVDLLVSFETIEHVDEDAQRSFLASIRAALKPDGVVIISTPEKEQYVGVDNIYHKHELTLEEFRDLLAGQFKYVELYGQRLAPASWITTLEGKHLSPGGPVHPSYVNHHRGVVELCPAHNLPASYIVAICSNEPLERREGASVLFDSGFALAIHNAHEIEGTMEKLNALSERLDELEANIGVESGGGVTLPDRVAAIEGELARQIERVSLQEQRIVTEAGTRQSGLAELRRYCDGLVLKLIEILRAGPFSGKGKVLDDMAADLRASRTAPPVDPHRS